MAPLRSSTGRPAPTRPAGPGSEVERHLLDERDQLSELPTRFTGGREPALEPRVHRFVVGTGGAGDPSRRAARAGACGDSIALKVLHGDAVDDQDLPKSPGEMSPYSALGHRVIAANRRLLEVGGGRKIKTTQRGVGRSAANLDQGRECAHRGGSRLKERPHLARSLTDAMRGNGHMPQPTGKSIQCARYVRAAQNTRYSRTQ